MDRQRTIFSALTSSVLWMQLFSILLCLAFIPACGGGGGGGGDVQPPPPTASTAVQFRIGDASSDRLVSVEATVEDIFLTNSQGTSYKVVPVSHQLEFTHLNGTLHPLYVSDVIQGTYKQLAIDGRDLHISYLDQQGNAQEYAFTGTTRIPVTLNPPLVVGSQPMIVSLDFDLASSISVDPFSELEPIVDPVFTVSSTPVATSQQQQPEDGAVEDVVGKVDAVSTGGAIAILGRDNSGLTFETDSNTRYSYKDTPMGSAPMTVVRIEGITRPDNSLLATKVDGLIDSNGTVIEGLYLWYAGYTGNKEMFVIAQEGIGSSLFYQEGALGSKLRVNITNAAYGIDTSGMDMSGLNFTTANIAPGSRVRIHSDNPFIHGDYSTTTNLVADKVVLEKQTVTGLVMNYQAGPPVQFDLRLPLDGSSFLQLVRPIAWSVHVYQQPGTTLKNLTGVQNNDTVNVRGLLFTDPVNSSYHLVAQRIWK